MDSSSTAYRRPPSRRSRPALRTEKLAAIDELRKTLKPVVASKLKHRPQYAFIRQTHKTLAAQAGVPKVARDLQQGHAMVGMDAQYLDPSKLSPLASAEAIWKAIQKPAEVRAEAEALRPAVGAESPHHELNRELNENQTVRIGKSIRKIRSQVIYKQDVKMVGASGFEPPTSASRTQRSKPS
jgi:hypothetical protein